MFYQINASPIRVLIFPEGTRPGPVADAPTGFCFGLAMFGELGERRLQLGHDWVK